MRFCCNCCHLKSLGIIIIPIFWYKNWRFFSHTLAKLLEFTLEKHIYSNISHFYSFELMTKFVSEKSLSTLGGEKEEAKGRKILGIF